MSFILWSRLSLCVLTVGLAVGQSTVLADEPDSEITPERCAEIERLLSNLTFVKEVKGSKIDYLRSRQLVFGLVHFEEQNKEHWKFAILEPDFNWKIEYPVRKMMEGFKVRKQGQALPKRLIDPHDLFVAVFQLSDEINFETARFSEHEVELVAVETRFERSADHRRRACPLSAACRPRHADARQYRDIR